MSLEQELSAQQQQVFALQRQRMQLTRHFLLLLFVDLLLCAGWVLLEHYLPRGGP